MKKICEAVGAGILILQTPSWLQITRTTLANVRDLVNSTFAGGLQLGWEIRAPLDLPLQKLMADFFRENSMAHVTDLSRETPLSDSEVAYTRLFGRGVRTLYQFDDQELEAIGRRASILPGKVKYFTFHTLKMYEDALRFQRYVQTGTFPPLTHHHGVASVLETIAHPMQFPIATSELLRVHGWKIFQAADGQKRRVSEVLARLPEKVYESHWQLRDSIAFLFESHSFKG